MRIYRQYFHSLTQWMFHNSGRIIEAIWKMQNEVFFRTESDISRYNSVVINCSRIVSSLEHRMTWHYRVHCNTRRKASLTEQGRAERRRSVLIWSFINSLLFTLNSHSCLTNNGWFELKVTTFDGIPSLRIANLQILLLLNESRVMLE